jgi:hypothetical protein
MMNTTDIRSDLISYISDAHKDAYGFRPTYWDLSSKPVDELHEIADRMSDAVCDAIDQERRERAYALETFEYQIACNIQLGARDRETAIRWIVQSLDLGDYATAEYACYRLGLSYDCAGMFEGILPKEFV